MAIRDDLINVGLKEKEADAYLSLLELGPASIVDLSKKSGVKRTTVYEVLKPLLDGGLVSETVFGRRKKYVAEPPEKFFEFKKRELDTLRSLLPTLEALRNVSIEKPALQFFQGKEAIQKVFEDMCLNTDVVKDKLLGIESKASTVTAQMGIQFFIDLLRKKKERGLESLTLDAMSEEELDKFAKQYPWSVDHGIAIRTLDDSENMLNTSIYLYQNKIALIAPDQLIALVIENQRLKKSFEFLFYKLWSSAQETKYKFE